VQYGQEDEEGLFEDDDELDEDGRAIPTEEEIRNTINSIP